MNSEEINKDSERVSLVRWTSRLSKPKPQPSTLSTQHSNHQPSALSPQPSTVNRQPSTVNRQSSTLNPQPSTFNPQPSTHLEHSSLNLNNPFSSCLKRLIPQPSTLNYNSWTTTFLKPQTLNPSISILAVETLNHQLSRVSTFKPRHLTTNLNHQPSTLDHPLEPSTHKSEESQQLA